MILENKISIPVMLYGILGFRMIILFFEILLIVKVLSKISKTYVLKRKNIFYTLVAFVILFIVWELREYYSYTIGFCGNSTREEIDAFLIKEYSIQKFFQRIENIVILISISIYTIFRIGEMPKEK